MDQITTGHANAENALMLNGGLAQDPREAGSARLGLSHGPAALQLPGERSGKAGLRSERVLSLLIALEALRAAPR